MQQVFHLLLDLLGIAVGLGLLGWCLYRIAILFGIITVKKRPPKASRTTMKQDEGQGRKKTGKEQKRPVTNLPRQTLYSARRERD